MSRIDSPGRGRFFLDAIWPDQLPTREIALFRARVSNLLEELVDPSRESEFSFRAGFSRDGRPPADAGAGDGPARSGGSGGDTLQSAPTFTAVEPLYTFDRLILPLPVLDRILDLMALIELQPLVFDTWNLRQIEPRPSAAINFRGPPGTGKTMAAHAVAHRLGRKILFSRLSDLESKFHGDGPKNLVQLFRSAQEQDAVLLLDEAESLLSRRFASPEQAAESAINSMRTELFMALDAFTGIAIFASNLPGSYDAAVDSRLYHVDFSLPDYNARKDIWRVHLPAELPLEAGFSIDELASVEGISGRDIKQAIISAALSAARAGSASISQEKLMAAAQANLAKESRTPVAGVNIPGNNEVPDNQPPLAKVGRTSPLMVGLPEVLPLHPPAVPQE